MTEKRAMEILYALSLGRDPLTDLQLPVSHVCNQPAVIRALIMGARALCDTASTPEEPVELPKKPKYPNSGKPWSTYDDVYLCQLFDEGTPVEVMCRRFGRSPSGIAARLVRLGKIEQRRDLRKANPSAEE